MSILDEFSEYERPVTVHYASQGGYTGSEWAGSGAEPTELTMLVLPTKSSDLKFLPEGTNFIEAKTFYCKERVASGGDQIELDSKKYTIMAVKDWEVDQVVKHFGVIKDNG